MVQVVEARVVVVTRIAGALVVAVVVAVVVVVAVAVALAVAAAVVLFEGFAVGMWVSIQIQINRVHTGQ